MTGIILAGGERRRMVINKAFIKVNGAPIVERSLRILRGLFDEIIIVTNDPGPYISYRTILVGDIIKNRGPMIGVYSGLLNSRNNYSFVVACDMPFLNRSLISFMMGLTEGNDIVVPRFNGLVEPLHAIYSKKCLYAIEEQIEKGNNKIADIFNICKVRYVDEDEIVPIDPEGRSFINLNTPEDLRRFIGEGGGE